MSNAAHDVNTDPNHGNRRHSNLSNLEKNCNQIFVKAPNITKEFLEKINNDVVPQKTQFLGYQLNTRRFIVLSGLILLFTISMMGTITMWLTDAFQRKIESMISLSEDAIGYDMWKAPPVKPYARFYLFNYTNVKEFELGEAKKLRVEEIGPYVYNEELEKVNIRFNKVDGTVTYQDKRTFTFLPELSKGTRDDTVIVPNLPMLSGASVVKKLNFIMRLSFNGLLKAISAKPFKALKAHEFIEGYNDNLYDLSKTYLKWEDKRVFENFGLLVWRKGTQPDIMTMNTGVHDINKLGQIEKINGQTHFDYWGSESCNHIQASEGITYPKDLVKAKKDLSFFIPQMCRKLPIKFVEETTMLDKVPVYRYRMPMNVFDNDTQENQCFCEQGICAPKGLFNGTKCTFGAPVFYSFPYLYGTDPAIRNGVDGLNKDPNLNDTYADIHPKWGAMMKGKIKLQVNIQVQKSFGVSELKNYPDGLMLPMFWIEFGLEEKDLPQDVVNMIYQLTFSVRNMELGLKYGCLLSTMVTLTCILLVLKKQRESRSRVDSIRQPIATAVET